MLNDCDGIDEEDLQALDSSDFENIVVFTAKEYPQHRCTFYLPCFEGETCVGNTMKKSIITGKMLCEKYFDFVGWFNKENGNDLENYRYR